MSGAFNIAYKDIRKNWADKKKAETRVAELSTKDSELEKAHAEKESKLDANL